MTFDPNKHHRRSIRLRDYDYSKAGAYFITVRAKSRENIFGAVTNREMVMNEYGKIVEDVWLSCGRAYPFVDVDTYIVMPDHFHGIVLIGEDIVGAIHELPLQKMRQKQMPRWYRRKMTLPMVIGRFKMVSARSINRLRGRSGTAVWQRNYYEHIIRDEVELNRVREYVASNPFRQRNS